MKLSIIELGRASTETKQATGGAYFDPATLRVNDQMFPG